LTVVIFGLVVLAFILFQGDGVPILASFLRKNNRALRLCTLSVFWDVPLWKKFMVKKFYPTWCKTKLVNPDIIPLQLHWVQRKLFAVILMFGLLKLFLA